MQVCKARPKNIWKEQLQLRWVLNDFEWFRFRLHDISRTFSLFPKHAEGKAFLSWLIWCNQSVCSHPSEGERNKNSKPRSECHRRGQGCSEVISGQHSSRHSDSLLQLGLSVSSTSTQWRIYYHGLWERGKVQVMPDFLSEEVGGMFCCSWNKVVISPTDCCSLTDPLHRSGKTKWAVRWR